jgi:hypothetical protein
MVDWVVILTPLFALGLLLLLGFAGCKFEQGELQSLVYIVVRVPTGLTVTEIVFRCTPPTGPMPDVPVPNPAASSTDGGDNLYSHSCGTPVNDAWTVGCKVTVSPGGPNDQATAQGTFPLDGADTQPVATFQTSRDTSGSLIVAYMGLS